MMGWLLLQTLLYGLLAVLGVMVLSFLAVIVLMFLYHLAFGGDPDVDDATDGDYF